jgi:hypothetical protein
VALALSLAPGGPGLGLHHEHASLA